MISLLNRLTFGKLPNFLFDKNLPVIIGTARGGHTTIQNWLNVTLLDYLDINYSLSVQNRSIRYSDQQTLNPLAPLDLRSIFNPNSPLFGYISNDPGFVFNLRNRKIFIFVRSPFKTYQSLYVLAKEHYKYNQDKAIKYPLKYLNSWSKRFSRLLEMSNKKNFKIIFCKSEELFSSPAKNIQNILIQSNIYIPKKLIKESIMSYEEKFKLLKVNSKLSNPRNSYKSRYVEIQDKEKSYIKSLFLYEYYKNSN